MHLDHGARADDADVTDLDFDPASVVTISRNVSGALVLGQANSGSVKLAFSDVVSAIAPAFSGPGSSSATGTWPPRPSPSSESTTVFEAVPPGEGEVRARLGDDRSERGAAGLGRLRTGPVGVARLTVLFGATGTSPVAMPVNTASEATPTWEGPARKDSPPLARVGGFPCASRRCRVIDLGGS